MSIKDRLIQYVFRGKNELSPEARKIAEDLDKVRSAGKELSDELDQAKGAQGLAVGLRGASEAAERAQSTLERTEKRAAELREELDKTPGSKGLGTSLRAAEREAARAARELDKLTVQTKQVEAAAQAAGIDTRRLAEEEARLATEVDKAKRAVTDNTKQLRDLERQQRAAARAAGEHKSRVDAARQSMSSGAKQVLGFAAAYVSLNSALGLVRRGIDLVRGGIALMYTEGRDAEDSIAQLNAALTATGGAAGWSAEQLLEMADELRDVSNYTTEQIIDGQTRLLSYTGVVGKEYPAAMQIVIDQAQRLGISVEQSAETVGQALESPSKAMAALGRQGFTLEKSQQDLLIRLEATGRMAEAQAIIMDMLTESYGGSAAAARMGTATGLWKGLQDQIGDFFGMISGAGAFDYVKDKLQEWTDKLVELKNSGQLQELAESLSNAFIQGAEKVEEFIKSLAKVDFDTLIQDSAAWLNNFGQHIDDARMRVQLFFAPFRTLFNGVTSGISSIGYAVTRVADGVMQVIGAVATAIPDMLGGDKLRAGVQSARNMLFGMREGFVAQIEQDGQDIRNAWDTTAKQGVESQREVVDAAAVAEKEKREAAEATTAKVEELNERFKQSAVDAAVAGTRAITDMADAMNLIDTASTVDQLEGLKQALQDAYRAGSITQEEYNAGLNLTNEQIRKLTPAAAGATASIDDLVKSLEGFIDLQQAIKGAETDVDISKLGTATRKMYSDGKLTAEEYRKALADLEKQKAEVKEATESQSTSERGLASSIDQVTQAINKKKAAEQADREVAAQAAADRVQQMNGISAYVDAVMTSAREPLAALSQQALAAFDALNGISSADTSIDTSGIEAARASLERLQESMGHTQRELDDNLRGPFAKWASENIQQSQQIRQQYLKQKLALQELMDRYESGATTLAGFRQGAMSLKGSLSLLDDSDLNQLESAIASAEQQMRSLGDSARGTLNSVRDELDRLRGDEEAIERRRMESRRRELQAQLAEARGSGNSQAVNDLQQAIGMLSSIESEQRLAREQAERDNRREPTQATGPDGATQPAAAPAAPSTVIRLESARGAAVDVAVPTGQEEALLSILEQAGMRTI
ncbi:phage tail length tape measure family protein [Halopseudomonas bauzanensis]|uniref:Bacteriophage tail tape measure N-terminal domain-containing protein n=1 Tax=Halopseudomonas bauzanensis TaxID=653930 RepID=A0A4U0YEV4_9GAMM|nr:phage tail length tape measure family protein [Halopseudomonas bauzanensis]TKA90400.1 hypothetical protein FA869_14895 [Halopseudomonas bauzanensis]